MFMGFLLVALRSQFIRLGRERQLTCENQVEITVGVRAALNATVFNGMVWVSNNRMKPRLRIKASADVVV